MGIGVVCFTPAWNSTFGMARIRSLRFGVPPCLRGNGCE